MPCCLIIVAAMFPRVVLFFMWLTGYGARAFETYLWPILGFFFMPYTTCAYAIAQNHAGGLQGWGLALFIIGVIFDISSHSGSAAKGNQYRKRH